MLALKQEMRGTMQRLPHNIKPQSNKAGEESGALMSCIQTGHCSQMHINIGFGLDKARPTLRFWLSQNHSLNVIENLWTMLKSRVRLGGRHLVLSILSSFKDCQN